MKPYYEDDLITIYHGDCLELLPELAFDVVVTDPPYGINYETGWNKARSDRPRTIANDADTCARDRFIAALPDDTPCLIFGSWKQPRPTETAIVLTWEKTGSSGMGNLNLPWRPNTEEIYVSGSGFNRGDKSRQSSVISWDALCGDQIHPNEKPVGLLSHLIQLCPPGVILDSFMGSGSTLRAAKDLGRKAIGIEVDEAYCEIAAKRMGQEVLDLG